MIEDTEVYVTKKHAFWRLTYLSPKRQAPVFRKKGQLARSFSVPKSVWAGASGFLQGPPFSSYEIQFKSKA